MIAVFAVPSFRRTGVGTALLLERSPRPGPSGAVKDLLTVIAGAAGSAGRFFSCPRLMAARLLWLCRRAALASSP